MHSDTASYLDQALVSDLAEHLLANLAFFAQNGYAIYDDVHDRQLPGIDRFDRHLRHAGDRLPLSFVEQYTLTEASAELMTHRDHQRRWHPSGRRPCDPTLTASWGG